MPIGEIGGGRERPPLFASRIGNAGQADVHCHAIAWEGRSRPINPWREGYCDSDVGTVRPPRCRLETAVSYALRVPVPGSDGDSVPDLIACQDLGDLHG